MNNPITSCIQTNEMESNVVGFENLFHSENVFKMASCSKRKDFVVSMGKRLDAFKRMDRGESLKSIVSYFGDGERTL